MPHSDCTKLRLTGGIDAGSRAPPFRHLIRVGECHSRYLISMSHIVTCDYSPLFDTVLLSNMTCIFSDARAPICVSMKRSRTQLPVPHREVVGITGVTHNVHHCTKAFHELSEFFPSLKHCC